jgi:hypothetical protein
VWTPAWPDDKPVQSHETGLHGKNDADNEEYKATVSHKGHTEGEADDDEKEKNYKRVGPKSSDRDNGDEHLESVNPGKYRKSNDDDVDEFQYDPEGNSRITCPCISVLTEKHSKCYDYINEITGPCVHRTCQTAWHTCRPTATFMGQSPVFARRF